MEAPCVFDSESCILTVACGCLRYNPAQRKRICQDLAAPLKVPQPDPAFREMLRSHCCAFLLFIVFSDRLFLHSNTMLVVGFFLDVPARSSLSLFYVGLHKLLRKTPGSLAAKTMFRAGSPTWSACCLLYSADTVVWSWFRNFS